LRQAARSARNDTARSARQRALGRLRPENMVKNLRAITVAPGIVGSARLDEIAEPPVSDGPVLARTVALGICGTDRDIVSGHFGSAPRGEARLVLGHESLGRVISAPEGCGLAPGDLVVGIVRRPDPVPCSACAAGEWDMCRNGGYTERGIKERHGYGAERFRIEPDFALKVDPDLGALGVLLEPASILAKAWDHAERIGRRSENFSPQTLLVTGAGPIGLLAAMMGAERGLGVHVYDHNKAGAKPRLVRELGGTYHSDTGSLEDLRPDIVMECTGVPSLIADLLGRTAAAGIVCLAGISNPGSLLDIDMGALNRTLVLDNDVVFGSVNANRRHYELAAQALKRADKAWLSGLITRRVPLDRWNEALEPRPGDIKVVIDFAA
jgi:threonine dehydrogenase-like Zn-dependent dehydrogenase